MTWMTKDQILSENQRVADFLVTHGKDKKWKVLETFCDDTIKLVVTNLKCSVCSSVHAHLEGGEWPWNIHQCEDN